MRYKLRMASAVLDHEIKPAAPFDGGSLLEFLDGRTVAGVEEVQGSAYRRTLRLARGGGIAEIEPDGARVRCRLILDDRRDSAEALAQVEHLLDLKHDPVALMDDLAEDSLIGPLVRARPGLRVPRAVDGFEIAVRAIVGQQVSVAGARTTLGRLVEAHGERLASPAGGLTHRFPAPEAIAAVPAEDFPFPRQRGEALRALARALAEGAIDLRPDADRERAEAQLLAIRGVGPWTASYISMRALGDPDAFLPTDLGVLRGLIRRRGPTTAAQADELALGWRPWRSYAVVYLWTKTYTLIGADGKPYESATPGTLGGHRRQKGYGRLDCPAALRWIAKGHYVKHRVFFADEATAIAAGYRPCAACLPEQYRAWKEGGLEAVSPR